MELKVTEIYHDGKEEITRVFHDVTELKEIVTHHGDIYPEIREYMSYWYEVWSGDTKLGGFSKDNSKVSLILNKTEQYQ